MKTKIIIILLIVMTFCSISNNVNAQAIKVEKFGLVLTRADNSKEWFLENTTKDSIKVFVVNHQEKFEELPGGVIAVSDGKHQKVEFTIKAGKKISLDYIVCYHSTGLMIGKESDATLIPQLFYANK